MGAAVSAIKSYFTVPAVWSCGIVPALGILAAYYAYIYIHLYAALGIAVLTILLLPFFLAGVYGLILDGNKKKGAFMIYARFGYPRCLLPSLLVGLICVLLSKILGTVGLFLCIPILFFTYFADITAIRHNLRTGQAFSDSAKRVTGGLIPVIAFYLGNIIAVIFMSIAMDLIFSGFLSVFGADALTSITSISESIMANPTAFYSNQTELLEMGAQLAAAPGLMQSFVYTLAVICLLFIPFLTAYKAYFFKALIAAQAVVAAAQAAAKKAAEQGSAEQKPYADFVQQKTEDAVFTEKKEDGTETVRSAEQKSPFAFLQQNENTQQIPQKPAYDPHAGEDGEYDEKGRWFKYR
ncbi:MAG TPA: hypothetical protein O0X97_01450 [Methanocorpusculum sp.]|nr:hypothetical protein [Methanocorpusculum sp.]